jgi:hypothetical protein
LLKKEESMRRTFLPLLGAGLLWALPAQADRVSVGLDVGGGYWFEGAAQFDLHFKVQVVLGSVVSLGFRPGILLNVRPGAEVGVPVDAYLRFHVSRLYFDLLGGLTILFGNPYPFRAHVAAGMGVTIVKGVSLGFEGGWLQNGAQLLARFSFLF